MSRRPWRWRRGSTIPTLSAFPSAALIAAEEAWDAAVANPALYAPNADREGGGPYPDEDVTDEFYWAAAELFITTGKPEYLAALKDSRWWTGTPFIAEGGDWKFVAPFAQLELVAPRSTSSLPPTRRQIDRRVLRRRRATISRRRPSSPSASPSRRPADATTGAPTTA